VYVADFASNEVRKITPQGFNRRGLQRRGMLFYRRLQQAILAEPISTEA
jgi:hypothetical protein